MPAWFLTMAAAPAEPGDDRITREALELAESASQAESASPVIRKLLSRARRELEGGQISEAAWWNSAALRALGLDAAAVKGDAASGEESEPEDSER
jgi:hypothetical protein